VLGLDLELGDGNSRVGVNEAEKGEVEDDGTRLAVVVGGERRSDSLWGVKEGEQGEVEDVGTRLAVVVGADSF